jgi:transmembrane sensor
MHPHPTEFTVPMRVASEAARWIARLHGPRRTRRMELDCLLWQSRSQAHRQAFECCTATWEEVGGLHDEVTATSASPRA